MLPERGVAGAEAAGTGKCGAHHATLGDSNSETPTLSMDVKAGSMTAEIMKIDNCYHPQRLAALSGAWGNVRTAQCLS
jgi:diaminopimelate epimerase